MIGLIGKQTAQVEFDSPGAWPGFGTDRSIMVALNPYRGSRNNNAFRFIYDPTNSGANPAQQALLSNVNVAFNAADFRALMSWGSLSNPETGHPLIVLANVAGRRNFSYTVGGTALSPLRKVRLIFPRPEHIELKEYLYGATNNVISGVYQMPFLPHAKYLRFSYTGITELRGKFNDGLITLVLFSIPSLNSIQRQLPKSLQSLYLALNNGANFGVTSNINSLIAKCSDLRELLCLQRGTNGAIGQNSSFPNGTIIDVSHCQNLDSLWIQGGAISGVTRHPTPANIRDLILWGCANLGAANFRSLLDSFLAHPNNEYLNLLYANQLQAGVNLNNTNISTSLRELYVGVNRWSGTISITASRPSLTIFRLGFGDTITSAASKNNYQNVDVSGLTSSVTIDLSNAQIENLNLPVNTVCTFLHLGGNKLDHTVNPNLINQIRAMTGLLSLVLSTGATNSSATSAEMGQNSTNGFGNNLDLSTLTSLNSFVAHNCKLSGTLAIRLAIQALGIDDNNVSGIAGTGDFTVLGIFNVSSNPNFDFNFQRLKSFTNVTLLNAVGKENTVIATIDLSGRTSIAQIGSITIRRCNALTTIIFPASPNAILAQNAPLDIQNNPLLSTLTGIENFSYAAVTQTRSFIVTGCPNVSDLKIGVGNFIPSTIQVNQNTMSAANVDLNIGNIWTNRRKWDTTLQASVAWTFNIGGDNAAAGGTYQAPAGYKTSTITGITRAATAIVTVAAIGSLVNGDKIRIRSVVGMTNVNHRVYTVKNIVGNTFELWDEADTAAINSTAFNAYTSGGTAYVEGTPASAKEQLFVLVNAFGMVATYN